VAEMMQVISTIEVILLLLLIAAGLGCVVICVELYQTMLTLERLLTPQIRKSGLGLKGILRILSSLCVVVGILIKRQIASFGSWNFKRVDLLTYISIVPNTSRELGSVQNGTKSLPLAMKDILEQEQTSKNAQVGSSSSIMLENTHQKVNKKPCLKCLKARLILKKLAKRPAASVDIGV
jgi:hypothetical protein